MVSCRRADSPSSGQDGDSGQQLSPDQWHTSADDAEEEIEDAPPVLVGYVPLGSEVLHTLDAGDNESDGDEQVIIYTEHLTVHREETETTNSPDCVAEATGSILDLDVDQLLLAQLQRSDFELCGGAGDASLYTDPLPDSTQATLWNRTERSCEDRITMDSEKVQEIRACMSRFSLPPSGFPEWAKEIPEELWTKQLMERLKGKHAHHGN
ncbi:hypothetical protein CLF_105536 [Clonorchis sinensis]|uniref:Male-enhanced antigen 1 n=1 Tax=Clonorchis sinensis TaxID=79923 RepID=G7YDP2_CLOSI|nr:hypothetical protein CLF_105536 [Clonorchis sinensis]